MKTKTIDIGLVLPWRVNVHGGAGECYEISVINMRKADKRCQVGGYGWHDANKIHISSSGGPCGYRLSKSIWDKMIILAQGVADELNAADNEN